MHYYLCALQRSIDCAGVTGSKYTGHNVSCRVQNYRFGYSTHGLLVLSKSAISVYIGIFRKIMYHLITSDWIHWNYERCKPTMKHLYFALLPSDTIYHSLFFRALTSNFTLRGELGTQNACSFQHLAYWLTVASSFPESSQCVNNDGITNIVFTVEC